MIPWWILPLSLVPCWLALYSQAKQNSILRHYLKLALDDNKDLTRELRSVPTLPLQINKEEFSIEELLAQRSNNQDFVG